MGNKSKQVVLRRKVDEEGHSLFGRLLPVFTMRSGHRGQPRRVRGKATRQESKNSRVRAQRVKNKLSRQARRVTRRRRVNVHQ